MTQKTKSEDTTQRHIVGILASAGGLEAASLLLSALPLSANATYIMAQHMSPTHKSLLSVLLSRETELDVVEIDGEATPQPNTIYVTPPNSDVVYENGKVCLREPGQKLGSPKPSGDRLLNSMAREVGENSVAIVLSGTGTDGNYGIKAVREVGGITIAQRPSSAKYDGMPASAIETGCVDLVLTPQEMGENFSRILERPRDVEGVLKSDEQSSGLTDLFQILKARTRIDFREYKESTVNRRVARRMVANDIEDYEEYVDFCRNSLDEVDSLGQDLLISVTRFFRDPGQFRQLAAAIREVMKSREDEGLRVWVAGCATGEEAYSIAILFAEAMGGLEYLKKRKIQIFATDVDNRALNIARKGSYPISAVEDIPDEYLKTYFTVSDMQVHVRQDVKQVLLFSHHNMITDPPFINVDLVSLRNVLIYFKPVLQERVFSRVDYALSPGGLLFVGTSETTLSSNGNFEVLRGSERVFRKRKSPSRRLQINMRDKDFGSSSLTVRTFDRRPEPPQRTEKERQFERLARAVAPNGFIANASHDILRIFGKVSNVLELNENIPLRLNTRILRGPMSSEAASLTTTALATGESRTGYWHQLDTERDVEFRLECYPLTDEEENGDTVLFAIRSREMRRTVAVLEKHTDAERAAYIDALEREMSQLRDTLNLTIEDLQKANEDMQAINEEFQSANEELQATNEEFETANEELQSTNEELVTVNDEMHSNTAELQRVTSELSSILYHSPYPVLIIDSALLIRRTSERALTFFSIDELPKSGLHVSQCALPIGFPMLNDICIQVMKTGTVSTTHLENGAEHYTISVSPFKDSDDNVMGLVLSIAEFDVTPLSVMANLMDQMGDISHWRVNIATGDMFWSDQVYRIYGLDPKDGVPSVRASMNYYHPKDRKRVETFVEKAIDEKVPFKFKATLIRADSEHIEVEAVCNVILDRTGTPIYLVGAFRQLTDVKPKQVKKRSSEKAKI